MNLQTIKSIDGKVEYVLLPIAAYKALSHELVEQLKNFHDHEDYELFDPADYVDNPIVLARIEAGITQGIPNIIHNASISPTRRSEPMPAACSDDIKHALSLAMSALSKQVRYVLPRNSINAFK